jgi:hypothetical protein
MDAEASGARENGWSQPQWGRRDGESDKAFEAFALYRDLGPVRSAGTVAEELGKSRALIERWSSRWGWVERSGAWDDEADRLRRERDLVERQEARKSMIAAHAKGGAALHALGSTALDRFDLSNPETAEQARALIESMRPLEAARLMEIGARLERLAREDSHGRVSDAEAQKFVDGLVDVSLRYIPADSVEAFLVDFEARLGLGLGI